jgi:hypothetical protein
MQRSSNASHKTVQGVVSTQATANFFVNEGTWRWEANRVSMKAHLLAARKNFHSFSSALEEQNTLIYSQADKLVYTGAQGVRARSRWHVFALNHRAHVVARAGHVLHSVLCVAELIAGRHRYALVHGKVRAPSTANDGLADLDHELLNLDLESLDLSLELRALVGQHCASNDWTGHAACAAESLG